MSDRVRINALFIVLCAIWGSTWLGIKIGLTGIPPFTGAAVRFAISGAILLVIVSAMRLTWPRHRSFAALVCVQAVFTFCANYGLIYWAEKTVPSGLAAVLFATFPLFTAIISASIFRLERLGLVHFAGLCVGFGGVAVVYWSEVLRIAHAPAAGVVAVLGAAVSAAIGSVAAKRYGSGVDPLVLVAPSQLVGAGLLGALAAVTEQHQPLVLNAATVGSIVYLTLLGSAFGFSALFWLLRRISVTRLSLITYVTPVIALVLGATLAHEMLAPQTYAGIALVGTGIWLMHAKFGATAKTAEEAG